MSIDKKITERLLNITKDSFFSLALISGVIVNTCGYIRQEGYESFKHVAKAFDGK